MIGEPWVRPQGHEGQVGPVPLQVTAWSSRVGRGGGGGFSGVGALALEDVEDEFAARQADAGVEPTA